MEKFPSIHFLKDVISNLEYLVKNRELNQRKFLFSGTVKLDGTNASLVKHENGLIEVQSRRLVLSETEDSYGVYAFFKAIGFDYLEKHLFSKIEQSLAAANKLQYPIEVYGEFAGKSIKSKKAVSKVENFFSIFNIHYGNIELETKNWLPLLPYLDSEELTSKRIFNSHCYPVFMVCLDLDRTDLAQEFIEKITQEVSSVCPAGLFFGINGPGEGLVWRCVEPGFENQRFWFKSKGASSQQRKSKSENEAQEKFSSRSVESVIEEFFVENRLLRGIAFLKESNIPVNKLNVGNFVSFLVQDVLQELPLDCFNDQDKKEFKQKFGKKSAQWYFSFINEQEV